MSLLGAAREQVVKPVKDHIYNAGWVYGPSGAITASEIQDIKDGDVDRKTGHRKCVFCRVPKPVLRESGCCDDYCEKQEHGGIPQGKIYAWDKARKGREWLTLG